MWKTHQIKKSHAFEQFANLTNKISISIKNFSNTSTSMKLWNAFIQSKRHAISKRNQMTFARLFRMNHWISQRQKIWHQTRKHLCDLFRQNIRIFNYVYSIWHRNRRKVHQFHESFVFERFANVAIKFSISTTSFTNIFANVMFENLSKVWIFEFSRQNSHTKSLKSQQTFARLLCLLRKIVCFLYNIKKSKILIFNNLRINHRINEFKSFNRDIQIQFKIDKERNRQLFAHFFIYFIACINSKFSRNSHSNTSYREWFKLHVLWKV